MSRSLHFLSAIAASVFSAAAFAAPVAFSFTDDPADGIFGRTHVAGTVTGIMYGLANNGTGLLPTSIQITSDVALLGMTDSLIDGNNSMVFWDASGFSIVNGVIASGSFGLNFTDPIVGGIQLRLNGEGYNLLHWNGGSSPVVGTGNRNGFAGATYGPVNTGSIPEPGSLALLGAAFLAAGFARKRHLAA